MTIALLFIASLCGCQESQDKKVSISKISPAMDKYLSAHEANGKFNGTLLV
jgi:hypothetical protein